MHYTVFLSSIFAVLLIFPYTAYGEIQTFTTDKTNYVDGETIFYSGKVVYDEDSPVLVIQVFNPSESDFAYVNQLFLSSNGSFEGEIVATGSKWTSEGGYKILVTYNGQTKEKIIQFKNSDDSDTQTTKTPQKPKTEISEENKSEKLTTSETTATQENLKSRVANFPSLDKSPEYYLNRYESEENYRDWFDSQFPNHSIKDVVSYPETHISNFPDNSNPPTYYIQRYQTEIEYKNWFDSQFPQKSIYSVLGFPEIPSTPAWIKSHAGLWAQHELSDSEFADSLQYLITEKILVLDDIPQTSGSSEIPPWIRDIAKWWSDGKISDYAFIQSLHYLIDQEIVLLN